MSFIPEVKMDFIPDDMSDESGDEIQVDESTIDESTIDEIEEVQEDLREQTNLEKVVPKTKSKREDMNIDEIFNMPQAKEQPQAEVKLTKKGKPRKKRPPMTEEHKAKLALAREKAMASRKKKAQERKENKALDSEEKELLKKQKVKRVKKLKEEVEDDDDGTEGAISNPSISNSKKETIKEKSFSKQDLEEAQLQAIMNYEKIRKSRKAQKKIQQEKNAEQEALRNQIRRAVAPPQKEYVNPYANCY